MNILNCKWLIKYKNKGIMYAFVDDKLIVENNTSQPGYLIFPKTIKSKSGYLSIKYEGKVLKDNSTELILMDFSKNIIHSSTLNSSSYLENHTNKAFLTLKVSPFAKVEISNLYIALDIEKPDYLSDLNNDILVITPNYPTLENKYMCGFVHSRLLEYKKAGLNFDVISCHNYNGIMKYAYENINISRMSFANLRGHLRRKKYKKIIVHFFDHEYSNIFDSLNLSETEMLFWVHGPETLYWDWSKFTTPYFKQEVKLSSEAIKQFENNDEIIGRYNNMSNVKWIFVSNWIKERSEKLTGIKFNNFEVIPNIINEKVFKYKNKDEKLRKKIFFIRRFDNCNKYAIDVNVRTILELSKRSFFDDLEFNLYGTGDFYSELTSPIRNFDNVNLHQKFLSHKEISKVHYKNGIAFFPTRYDAQGVSMCEAALSGLVVVTSDNPAIKEFLNNKMNVFSETENYKEYADIIENLYYNPNLFSKYSKECHKSIYSKCSYDKTISKEINLITSKYEIMEKEIKKPRKPPVLSILIPAYNVEDYIESCIYSILNIEHSNYLEIIIVNDGSTDNTLKKIRNIQKKFNYSEELPIKIVDKKNGGHGSTINEGLKLASGKYFRIIDSDDWVNSEDLNTLVKFLRDEKSDIVITDYSEDLAEENTLNKKEIYHFMISRKVYNFDDLCYEHYGFDEWGPVLATGNFRTDMLKKISFAITENSSYVDMEFNCYSILKANTITYYNLDIYRYFIGRVEQSVNINSFKSKYIQHRNVLFNIINIYETASGITDLKKKYIVNKLIVPMVNSHYIILTEYLKSSKEFRKFDNRLSNYGDIYNHQKVKTRFIQLNRKTSGSIIKLTPFLKKINSFIKKWR